VVELVEMGRFVKGELDWSVLKALSKDRELRAEYPTPPELEPMPKVKK
jgi:hypothetical protein